MFPSDLSKDYLVREGKKFRFAVLFGFFKVDTCIRGYS